MQQAPSVQLKSDKPPLQGGPTFERSEKTHGGLQQHSSFLPTLLILLILLIAFGLRAYNFDSWPPGLSNDEANNANDALRFARTLTMPLYQLDARPEPLFRFVQALTIATIGPTRFGFRIASLFMGVISVAAAYRAGRHLTSSKYARWVGLVAAACLAVMVSHIHLSRVGYRAMPQVLAMLLFLDAFVVGWRTTSLKQSVINFALAGVWLAVALLSYTAGLIMLPVAALGVGHQLAARIINRVRTGRLQLPTRGLAAFAVAFGIAITPLIALNVAQPNFYGRAAEVSAGSGSDRTPLQEVQRIIDRTENTWIMFNEFGDINPQYNVDRAPLLPLPLLYYLMLVGILTSVIYFLRLPFVLALAMLLLSLQPVALSNEIPHGLRIMGAFAAVPLGVAAGVEPFMWLVNRSTDSIRRYALPVVSMVLAGIFTFAGIRSFDTLSTYYQSDVRWGDNDVLPAFSWFFEMRRYALSEIIAESEQPVYVPLEAVDHSAGRYFTTDTHPVVQSYATYFDAEGDTLELPPGLFLVPPDLTTASTYTVYMPDGTLVLLPRFDDGTVNLLHSEIERTGDEIRDAYGELSGYQIERAQPLIVQAQPRFEANINYGSQIRLVGWDGPLDMPQGETVDVTLYFQRTENKQRDVVAFTQLWDWDNERIASSSEGNFLRWLYPPDQWQTDDIVPYVLRFTTPEELPSGAYSLVVGFRNHLEEPVPVLGADGTPVSETAIAGTTRVAQPEPPQPVLDVIMSTFGDEIALITSTESIVGDQLIVRLEWQAVAEPSVDYTAFVHLVDENDQLLAQSDVQLGGTRYPTRVWRIGDVLTSEHVLFIPQDASNTLTLYTGLYSFPSLERLNVPSSDDGRYQIGPVSR